MISDNLDMFAGKPVKDFTTADTTLSPVDTAYRLRVDWERHDKGQGFVDIFDELLAAGNVAALDALVIGDWGGTAEGNGADVVVESLVAQRAKLPKLKALFIGDMTSEESEISWINQTDMSPLWSAFPNLEELGIRGGEGLQLGRPVHSKLKKLTIEAGGLPPSVVDELSAAVFPLLEHLEIWLGTPDYGGDTTADQLSPLLEAGRFPKLMYLGIRNSEIADDIAAALAEASVLDHIEVLDLSLGTLSDAGVEALAANDKLKRLKKLDIHHHYASDAAVAKLDRLGIEVDASEQRESDDIGDGEMHRYVYAAE